MKAESEGRGIAPLLLETRPEVGGRHAAAAVPLGRGLGAHWEGGWLDLRASLDGCVIALPHRDSIPGTSSPQQVAIPPTLFQSTIGCKRVGSSSLGRSWQPCFSGSAGCFIHTFKSAVLGAFSKHG